MVTSTCVFIKQTPRQCHSLKQEGRSGEEHFYSDSLQDATAIAYSWGDMLHKFDIKIRQDWTQAQPKVHAGRGGFPSCPEPPLAVLSVQDFKYFIASQQLPKGDPSAEGWPGLHLPDVRPEILLVNVVVRILSIFSQSGPNLALQAAFEELRTFKVFRKLSAKHDLISLCVVLVSFLVLLMSTEVQLQCKMYRKLLNMSLSNDTMPSWAWDIFLNKRRSSWKSNQTERYHADTSRRNFREGKMQKQYQ